MSHREFFDHLAETWSNDEDPSRLSGLLELMNPCGWKRVLDVGTGTGILLPLLDADEIVALDLSLGMLRRAMENSGDYACFVQGSVQYLPFVSYHFDRVICFRSFPHFCNKSKALGEIYRVLKKNGRLYIAHTASREDLNSIHQRIGEVVAGDLIPDDSQMKGMLADSGFCEINVVDGENLYFASATKG